MFIDISKSIDSSTEFYEGDPEFGLEKVFDINNGSKYNVFRVTFGSHISTHIDSPYHFFENGTTAQQLDINLICGEAVVVTAKNDIDKIFLEKLKIEKVKRIIFRTGGKFGITKSGAQYLADTGVFIVGTDSADIEADGGEEYPAHKILLGNGIPILESLELTCVKDGQYKLICLPLKIESVDAVPVRAVLEEIL